MRFFLIFFSGFCFAAGLFAPIEPIKFNTQKAELGKKLYFETKFSANKISCDSCHNIYLNSSGTSRDLNTPTILNSALSTLFFQNNKKQNLNEKIKVSLTSKTELGSNPDTLITVIKANSAYQKDFQKLYEDGITLDNVADSLANFVKTLTTPNSKFDKFLKGEIELDKDERRGFELFLDLGCASCHNGVNLGSNNFQKAIHIDALVKVPTLRNITKTAPYAGGNENLGTAILNMSIEKANMLLNDYEIEKIIKFLETLNGELQ